jgi:hypothetical protein
MQPVAATPNDAWTNDLDECLKWFLSGEKRKVMAELLHRKPRGKKLTKGKKPRKASAKKAKVSPTESLSG